MIGLGKDVVIIWIPAFLALGGLDLVQEARYGVLLILGPSPGKLPSGMLLDGDDVPFAAGGNLGESLAAEVCPALLAGIAYIAVVIADGSPAAVVLRNGSAAEVHMDHLDVAETGGLENLGKMLHGILGEGIANEEDTESSLDLDIRIRCILARSDVYDHIGEARLPGGAVLAEILDLL